MESNPPANPQSIIDDQVSSENNDPEMESRIYHVKDSFSSILLQKIKKKCIKKIEKESKRNPKRDL